MDFLYIDINPAFIKKYIKQQDFEFPFSLTSENVIMEVVKKAEKEDSTVLRLYEPFGKEAVTSLKINNKFKTVFETDLMEDNISELKVSRGKIGLSFKPFEIKTLKIF